MEEKHQRGDSRGGIGEDWNGLEIMILKSLANFFQNARTLT